jgi:hypothetical protein
MPIHTFAGLLYLEIENAASSHGIMSASDASALNRQITGTQQVSLEKSHPGQ